MIQNTIVDKNVYIQKFYITVISLFGKCTWRPLRVVRGLTISGVLTVLGLFREFSSACKCDAAILHKDTILIAYGNVLLISYGA